MFENDKPLTEEQVKEGKYGTKIISKNAKKVPKDAFIIELEITYPGFLKREIIQKFMSTLLFLKITNIKNTKKCTDDIKVMKDKMIKSKKN